MESCILTETETTPVSGVHVTGTYVTETEKVALKDAFNLLLARCLSIYRTLKATNRAHRREFERKLRAANLGYVFFLVRAIGENWKDDAEAEVTLEIHQLTHSIYGMKLPDKQLPEFLQDLEQAGKLLRS